MRRLVPARLRRTVAGLAGLVLVPLGVTVSQAPALGATAAPTSVTIAGDFQQELGCPGDWAPDCTISDLSHDAASGLWQGTWTIPAGDWEFKAALDHSWNESYGDNGNNVRLHVTTESPVTFTYDPISHAVADRIVGASSHDDNVEWDGVRHDSRDPLYRTPGGALTAGGQVTLRLRTFADDVTAVKLRLYDVDSSSEKLLPMSPEATGAGCYQPDLVGKTCDFWSVTVPEPKAATQWYRFVVTDGSRTVYYGDDTAALDGGLGRVTDTVVDNSWALTVAVPHFKAPAWVKDAVIYQIFPDRFRNGRANNDPKTGDPRYDDPVLALPWGAKPEGYCHNYDDAATSCAPRFAGGSSDVEQPRGRDYEGGDLKGVDQKLDYLQGLGVNTIYFNPIFDAGSDHGYDTQDYKRIDPYLGTQKDFDNLVKHAHQRGMRIILDGVYNHMSSDSPIFDRYSHYSSLGACESVHSPYRSWFTFKPQSGGPCAGPGGAHTMTYDSWFGFDSIPVLTKSNADVQAYFLTSDDSVAKHWLQAGADGWRMDVMGDASFPDGYWETFRRVVKDQKPDALIISETWQKDSTLLRMLRGDRADSTMNYRLRDAVIGLLAPQDFDAKGFADSGKPIAPTAFASRIASMAEDYAPAALYSAMNLLDSHDTERLLWTLTPGPQTTASKEGDAAHVAEGKRRVELASMIQFSMPGAPTVYYGDEVGVTGDDDPDDRRAYPWEDRGGHPDLALLQHYTTLATVRRTVPALRDGDLRVLATDDSAGTVALGRKDDSSAAVLVVNTGSTARSVQVPVVGWLPDGVSLHEAYRVGGAASGAHVVASGRVAVDVPALGAVWLTVTGADLTGPAAPTGVTVAEGATSLTVSWDDVRDATSYDVLVSPVSGGGYVRANSAPVTGRSFTISGLDKARTYHVVVRAVDAAGNLGALSDEVTGLPHDTIGWANLQWPPTLTHTISAVDRTDDVYGQVWIDGVTSVPGATPGLRAQLGYGPAGTQPSASWSWLEARFNVDAGHNDEFVASLLPDAVGTYAYAYRYSTTDGRDWVYAGRDGITPPLSTGELTVLASSDTVAPDVPSNLHVVTAGLSEVRLAWDAVADGSLYGYEVSRIDADGRVAVLGQTTAAAWTDSTVTGGSTYSYRVRAVDTSLNRSDWSSPVAATAEVRKVAVTFRVTVPADTPADKTVYVAGYLDRLDGGLPQWNPSGVALTRVPGAANQWQVTLTGDEGTQLEYKYALGDWSYVEKDASCGEISNRTLTLQWGADGTQLVDDTVPNWNGVGACA